MNDLERNGSGYRDPTASAVLTAIHKQEMEADEKANRVIKMVKEIIRLSGFELIERVQLRHKHTGREYK